VCVALARFADSPGYSHPTVAHRPHRHRLGFVLTALLVTAGVAVFVGLRATVNDLGASLDRFYAQSRFADLTVVGGDTDAIAREARLVDGVAAVNARGATTLSVFLRNGKTKVQGTVIGVPATGPDLNRLSGTAGHPFDRATTKAVAVVEQHTADDLDVRPGATIQALGIGTPAMVDVVGVGLSPEYLLPAQSQQQIVTTPGSFAVLFVPQSVVEQLGGAATISQVLIRYAPGVDRGALDARLTTLANAHDADLVEPLAGQPSNAVIAEEETGFREASIVIPAIALIVATLIAALACARVDDERRRRRALAVTIVASGVGGVAFGLIGAAIGGPALADSVYLPAHVGANNLGIALVGFALALLTGAAALGIGRLLRVGNDDALGFGPAAVTAIAAAAAMICVVAPGGVTDSAQATLNAAGSLERVSAQVAFATPVSSAQLATLTAIDGIAAAEAVPSANVFVRHGNRRYSTELEAFPADTTMQHFEAPDGSPIQLPATGALIPEALGSILNARPGDELEITLPGAGVPPITVPVAALTSNTLGNLVFLRTSGLREALGVNADAFAGGLFDTASIRFAPGADAARIARQVQAEAAVVVYVPVAADLNTVAQARPIFSAVIDALLAIGAVVTALGLGSAVVLHAHTRRRIGGRRLTVEVLAAVVVGIVIGVLLGTFAADRLVQALDTDLIHLVRHIDISTYLLAAGMVLLVTAGTLALGFFTAHRDPSRRPRREGDASTPPVAVG
jgi:putative ABC transport system permease protein